VTVSIAVVIIIVPIIEGSISDYFQDRISYDSSEKLKSIDPRANPRIGIYRNAFARDREFISEESVIVPIPVIISFITTSVSVD
jgi:hypothetical protein